VTLHSIDILIRDVDAAASTLKNSAGRNDRARHGDEFAVDDIANGQLVRGEVVVGVRVVPDVCAAVLLVRLIFRTCSLAYALVGCVAVPVTLGIGQIEVLEAGDRHRYSFLGYERCAHLRVEPLSQ
jgi:hypothetical protein